MEDEWTPIQFDNAVKYLGIHIENKLSERDKDGRPVWTLAELLGDEEETKKNSIDQLMAAFGVMEL